MWPFKYPYTNFHELNLDWILDRVKYLSNKVDKIPAEVQNEVNKQTSNIFKDENLEKLASEALNKQILFSDAFGISEDAEDNSENVRRFLQTGIDENKPCAFRPGKYVCNSPVVLNFNTNYNGKNNSVLYGNGATIYFTESGFELANNNNGNPDLHSYFAKIQWSDLYIDGTANGSGLSLGNSYQLFDSLPGYVIFNNVNIQNKSKGVVLKNARHIVFNSCSMRDIAQYAFEFLGNRISGDTSFCGDILCLACEFEVNKLINIYNQSQTFPFEVRGLHFTSCQFYGGGEGIYIGEANPYTAVRPQDWFFTECQFDQMGKTIFGNLGENFNNLLVSNSYFVGVKSIMGAYLSKNVSIKDCTINCSEKAFTMGGSNNVSISGNIISQGAESSFTGCTGTINSNIFMEHGLSGENASATCVGNTFRQGASNNATFGLNDNLVVA